MPAKYSLEVFIVQIYRMEVEKFGKRTTTTRHSLHSLNETAYSRFSLSISLEEGWT